MTYLIDFVNILIAVKATGSFLQMERPTVRRAGNLKNITVPVFPLFPHFHKTPAKTISVQGYGSTRTTGTARTGTSRPPRRLGNSGAERISEDPTIRRAALLSSWHRLLRRYRPEAHLGWLTPSLRRCGAHRQPLCDVRSSVCAASQCRTGPSRGG